jgi:hypothetical protein
VHVVCLHKVISFPRGLPKRGLSTLAPYEHGCLTLRGFRRVSTTNPDARTRELVSSLRDSVPIFWTYSGLASGLSYAAPPGLRSMGGQPGASRPVAGFLRPSSLQTIPVRCNCAPGSIASHACKKRKDGPPSVIYLYCPCEKLVTCLIVPNRPINSGVRSWYCPYGTRFLFFGLTPDLRPGLSYAAPPGVRPMGGQPGASRLSPFVSAPVRSKRYLFVATCAPGSIASQACKKRKDGPRPGYL